MIDEMQKLISVIIPVYNVRDYLERCLNSILENTYKNLEVICVNDGSSDDSLKILKHFAEKDKRIKIVDKKISEGVSSARNSGLDAASGDYIAFIDSDDWIHRRYFEILVYFLNRDNTDVSVCRNIKTFEMIDDKPVPDTGVLKINEWGINEISLDHDTICYVWGRLYKKDHIGKARFIKKIKFAEDKEFNVRVLCGIKDLKVSVVEFPLYYYFQRSDSAVHTLDHAEIIYAGESILKFAELDSFSADAKKVLLFRAFKDALAARYVSMFYSDGEYKIMSRRLIKKCCKLMNNLDNISFKEKTKYRTLAAFPIVYRMYRIITDPSMLDWEKNRRKAKNNK